MSNKDNSKQSKNEQPRDEGKEIADRKAKLAKLRENGQAFPNDFRRNIMSGELHAEYGEKDAEEIELRNVRVKVAGRMMTKRIMGKAAFAHIQDMSGQISCLFNAMYWPMAFITSTSRSGIWATSLLPVAPCLKQKPVSYRSRSKTFDC